MSAITLSISGIASAAPQCAFVHRSSQAISVGSQSATDLAKGKLSRKTLLESEISRLSPPLPVNDRLSFEISRLKKKDSDLARQVTEVRNLREKGKSVEVDRSHLPTHMNLFLEGAYAQIAGPRGLSRPFVSFEAIDGNSLLIRHLGDEFPMLVRWNPMVKDLGLVHAEKKGGVVYQVLEIPESYKDRRSLSQIEPWHIHALISGSIINKYISPTGSAFATMAAALHDGRLIFDRPTQAEAKQVRKLISESPQLRGKMKSLLFVAPTASGKTRVLGDAIIDLIQKERPGKVIVLATKTPDLTTELGRNIGAQLHETLGLSKFRLLQWGGQLSENMTHQELIRFVDRSEVPVVLVTSYPTLASRAPSPGEKARLLSRARAFLVDEAHNATGQTFTDVMRAAKSVEGIEILGVTASPITRTQRTAELYDGVFWAAVDKPGQWVKDHEKNSGVLKDSDRAIEWVRMAEQYKNARERGEINSSEPIYYRPEEHGFSFSTIFKRGDSGTSSSVNLDRLKEIWPGIAQRIEGHGPGVIHTYPRDAGPVAELLSKLSNKNYLSLQKLSQEERVKVYEAFRTGGLYQGKTVDAIVGTIREGLDFPKAGWYLNFKKYVKFPENIQGPGRVVRLAHNKLNPVIMFFGEEVGRSSYAQVKELVMNQLGKLPRQLPEGRLYSGMRRQGQRQAMVRAIENLNANMEAFFRIHSAKTRALGPNKDNLNPEAIKNLQAVLNDLRYSSVNREIDQALNQFLQECYTYPFFRGDLNSSWAFAERLVALSKLTAEQKASKKISPLESEYTSRPEVVEMAKEFRGFLANIGPIPRSILETMDLRLINVTEVAEATNTFVRHHGKAPEAESFGPNALNTALNHALAISPQGIWRNLSPEAKRLLSSRFDAKSKQELEITINEFFAQTRKLPEVEIELAISHERDVYTNLGNRLAVEMNRKLQTGQLDVSVLSAEARTSLEKSHLLAGMVLSLRDSLYRLNHETVSTNEYVQRLKEEGYFTYDYLMLTSELGLMKTIKDLAELNPQGEAASYQRSLSEQLSR